MSGQTQAITMLETDNRRLRVQIVESPCRPVHFPAKGASGRRSPPPPVFDNDSDMDDIAEQKLVDTTWSNKKIPFTQVESEKEELNADVQPEIMPVFGKETVLVSRNHQERLVHVQYGVRSDETFNYRHRSYFVAYDGSQESIHAMEWTMSTMLRDGDELHIVSVADEPGAQIEEMSRTLMDKAKSALGSMVLYDIMLVVHTLAGRAQDTLLRLIRSMPKLTMVVCGSRGRSTVKGLMMGSISSYLVHHSPTPVSVITRKRPKKCCK